VHHLFAAAPYEEFVREHSPLLAVLVFVLLALLIVRLVIRTMTRVLLLGLLLMLTLFVYVERTNIRDCTQSCRCTVAGFDVELPACDPQRFALG
jgi:uncharacterized membrane protein